MILLGCWNGSDHSFLRRTRTTMMRRMATGMHLVTVN
jgi:hypothetical protein